MTVLILCCDYTAAAYAGDDAVRKDSESSTAANPTAAPQENKTTSKPPADLSGRKRVGKASFYARQFSGKTMADGAPMDPQGDNAASRTLPLGTTAKVTNVETGKTAVVTIEDRGPYVDGRLVDLSPGTAEKIGLTPKKGVTKVVVAPIVVPLPNGKLKVGTAAHEPADKPDTVPPHEEKVAQVAKELDATGQSATDQTEVAHAKSARKGKDTQLASAAGGAGGTQHEK